MHVRVKFCGLTRAGDVETATGLGADYVGVVFAGGPRNTTPDVAAEILRSAGSVRRVGVFGKPGATELGSYVRSIPLSVAQLHGDASPKAVMAARAIGVPEVWAVVPVLDGQISADAEELFQCASAVVLDTGSRSGLGGTGRSFDWAGAARMIEEFRGEGRARLVVAGGLNPENVGEAIRTLRPDIVDVSSGVESAPGVKDPILMSRFIEAARSA